MLASKIIFISNYEIKEGNNLVRNLKVSQFVKKKWFIE